jgi:hypothetical protein
MSTVSIAPLEEKVDVLVQKSVVVQGTSQTQDYAMKFVCAALSSEPPSSSGPLNTTAHVLRSLFAQIWLHLESATLRM